MAGAKEAPKRLPRTLVWGVVVLKSHYRFDISMERGPISLYTLVNTFPVRLCTSTHSMSAYQHRRVGAIAVSNFGGWAPPLSRFPVPGFGFEALVLFFVL